MEKSLLESKEKALLDYQRAKRYKVKAVTGIDLIYDEVLFEDFDEYEIGLVTESFECDSLLEISNCLHCNIYTVNNCNFCQYYNEGDRCSNHNSTYARASELWEYLANKDDKMFLIDIGNTLLEVLKKDK